MSALGEALYIPLFEAYQLQRRERHSEGRLAQCKQNIETALTTPVNEHATTALHGLQHY